MASSIFGNSSDINPNLAKMQQLKQVFNGNPQPLLNFLMNNNRSFAEFAHSYFGQPLDRIAEQKGVNFDSLKEKYHVYLK